MGITAIALYEYVIKAVSRHLCIFHLSSYDAVEDNEISFKEDDKIIEIEKVSGDWWQGRSLTGHVGFFPGMCRLQPDFNTEYSGP